MKAEKWKTGKKIEAILICLTVILLGSVLGGLLNSNQKKRRAAASRVYGRVCDRTDQVTAEPVSDAVGADQAYRGDRA